MRVRVLSDKCEGHGRCWSLAPDLFEPDELGNAHEQNAGVLPRAGEPEARLAAANCPEFAIEIIED